VTDAARPTLLSTAPVAGAGTETWSQAFWDDKSLAVVDAMNLVAVPFQAWDANQGTPQQGLQLIDFSNTAVTARGQIQQPGSIQRAIPVGARLATLSDLSFVTSDLSDRDHPQTVRSVELVRNVIDFAMVPGGAVQLLGPRDWTNGETLRLRTVQVAHADDGAFSAELLLPESAGRMFTNGSLVYVAGEEYDRQSGANHLRVRVVDASDLNHPSLRAVLEIPAAQNEWFYGLYNAFWGGPGGGDSGMALVDGTLLAFLSQTTTQQNNNTWTTTQELNTVDLSNPDAPIFASSVSLGAQWAWGILSDGRMVYMTHAEYIPQGNNQPGLVRDYMDRVDLSNPSQPSLLPSVNIPGLLVAVEHGGARIYTIDYQWSGQNPVDTFDTLSIVNDTALLDQALPIAGEISRVRMAGGFAWFTTEQWWWQAQGQAGVSTALHTIDVTDAANGNMREVSTETLAGNYTLRDAQAGHLFLETGGFWWWGVADGVAGAGARPVGGDLACIDCFFGGGDSLVVFDIGDPAHPVYSSAARLNGWIDSLVVDATQSPATVYLPSGFYGVQSVALPSP
jgi:hypothetical protein